MASAVPVKNSPPENSPRSGKVFTKILLKGQKHFIAGTLPTTNKLKKALKPNVSPASVGRVFWTSDSFNYYCSASVITSNNKNLIITAGHCCYDTGTKSFTVNKQWIFVPQYNNGNAPYGQWVGQSQHVLDGWLSQQNVNADVCMCILSTNNGKRISKVVGSQGIGWNYSNLNYIYSFGYPYNINNGQIMSYCATKTVAPLLTAGADHKGQRILCTMSQGCSGGPWLKNFSTSTGLGIVISVNSFAIEGISGYLYGPYFDNSVMSLYNHCQNKQW
ncbi:unnamed protein product [Didymodactylos carnosus]|nr:unnamed protein product [Didymodactylos carnosus]CAF4471648.1 unnamed protein product [Didymodactylos carnosus]